MTEQPEGPSGLLPRWLLVVCGVVLLLLGGLCVFAGGIVLIVPCDHPGCQGDKDADLIKWFGGGVLAIVAGCAAFIRSAR